MVLHKWFVTRIQFSLGQCCWIWPHFCCVRYCFPCGSVHRCINKIPTRSLLEIWASEVWWKGLLSGGVGDYSRHIQAKPAKNLTSKRCLFFFFLVDHLQSLNPETLNDFLFVLFCFVLITHKREVPVLSKSFLGFLDKGVTQVLQNRVQLSAEFSRRRERSQKIPGQFSQR